VTEAAGSAEWPRHRVAAADAAARSADPGDGEAAAGAPVAPAAVARHCRANQVGRGVEAESLARFCLMSRQSTVIWSITGGAMKISSAFHRRPSDVEAPSTVDDRC